MTHHTFRIALLFCVAVVSAVVAHSSVVTLGDALAAGITRSPVAYIPIVSRNNDGLPTPTATPAPPLPDLPTATPASPLPDLVITHQALTDTYAYPGALLHFSMTIRNQGEGPANGFDVGWNPLGSTWIIEAAGLNLAAGQDVTIQWQYTWDLADDYATAGVVDYGNQIAESNEANNTDNLLVVVNLF